MSRKSFVDAAASEKITLARIEATVRYVNFTDMGGGIYFKQVDRFVSAVKVVGGSELQRSADASIFPGEFYYDPLTSTVFIRMPGDSNPNEAALVFTVRLFFGTHAVSLPHDLQPTSPDVYWDGRIARSPQFQSKIGIDQNLVSTIGRGSLELENSDGELDGIYDTLVFENQQVDIYSINRDQPLSAARLIFTGIIHDKSYDSEVVSFNVKDLLFNLLENVPQSRYTEEDAVNKDIIGRAKRWVYGRVDGLRIQSVDQIGEGFEIAGTVTIVGDSNVCTGLGTDFLNEVSPGDEIRIGNQEFRVETVNSETELILDDEAEYGAQGVPAIIVPAIPTRNKNRQFFVAEHATAQINRTVVNALQFNRIRLNDTTGILAGDVLNFLSTGERVEVRNVAPGNIVVLQQNVVRLPAAGSEVIRQPIQEVYVEGVRIRATDFTINNTPEKTTIDISPDAEFNIAPIENLNQTLTFTNGSRSVTGGANLREVLSPRDFIRPEDQTFINFYEILEVRDSEIILRRPFMESNIVDTAEIRRPKYIADDTVLSVDILGRTEDNTPNGRWLQTSSDVVRDLVRAVGLSERINEASFADTSAKTPALVSFTLPLTPDADILTLKDAVDLIAASTNCALSLNNNLELTYNSTLVVAPQDVRIIDDSDVVRWKINSKSGKLYRFSSVKYRHQDVDRFTLEEGNRLATKTNKFVENFVGTSKTIERDIYLYNEFDASIYAERILYYNSLSLTEITLESDLRIEDLEVGDIVQLEFARLYKRFGDSTSRKKLCSVAGRTVTGDRLTVVLTDYGNTFNTSAFICPNTAVNYLSSGEDEKIKQGYVTDGQGIIDNIDDSGAINRIS